MTALRERLSGIPTLPDIKSAPIRDILTRLPSIVEQSRTQVEQSNIAKTPEGAFALSYLVSVRNVLKPAFDDITNIPQELLQIVGGNTYNPECMIDVIGDDIATLLANQIKNLPHLWIRTEEGAAWENPKGDDTELSQGRYFAVIDPLDETGAISKGKRFQTSAIAIYSREGTLLTLGIVSLVDEKIMFFEHPDTVISPSTPSHTPDHNDASQPIRIATMTRRMHALRDLPLFQKEGAWSMDTIGGYGLLAMNQGEIDAMIDPVKGNPWFEYLLWGPAAEKMGFTVTDPEGNPIDAKAIMKTALEKNPDNSYRIPFVTSRTPEIQSRILSLLKPSGTT